MKITIKTGIIFAFFWMAIKMIIFWSSDNPENPASVMPGVLTNMFCLLMAIAVGLFLHKKNETDESNVLGDIKNAMSAGVPYILLVSIFIYLFYTKINPEYIQHKQNETIAFVDKGLNDPKILEEFRKSQPDAEVMTKNEIRESMIESQTSIISAGATTTLSLLAMLLLTTLNSIFVTVVYRKLVFR
ncbi:MAG: hypothetical protein MK066_15095 [Crocinitomicaceae bacterium]|nr:hypothetical protein [Crocinitomicaceae bacterium]